MARGGKRDPRDVFALALMCGPNGAAPTAPNAILTELDEEITTENDETLETE
jgi:hypothetical protein